MKITSENYEIGNMAMSNVLLLYFHILTEKGITNDQTIFLDSASFDPVALLHVVVTESAAVDIDQSLIREGVMIYWLCELNDVVLECDDDFHNQPYFTEVYKKLESVVDSFPEVSEVLENLNMEETKVNFEQYKISVSKVVQRYVIERMQKLVQQSES